LFPDPFTSGNSLFLLILSGAGEYAQGKQGVSEQRQVNLLDNLSVIKGAHQLKFGVDYLSQIRLCTGHFFSSRE
jgi:hypothetical protein